MSETSNEKAAGRVLDRLDREVWVLTSRAGRRRGGLVATFVSRASIVPSLPRVLVGLAHHHHTRELVEESGAFALHLIGEERLDWVWRFGLSSGRASDKLHGLASRESATGSPLLEDAMAFLDCRVEARLDAGDRTVYLAEVVDGADRGGEALTTRRLFELAPEERIRELRERMETDARADAEAIELWRRRRRRE